MGMDVILEVPISLSPDASDVLVDFVVLPCTPPLLLGAPFMETYGARRLFSWIPTPWSRTSSRAPPLHPGLRTLRALRSSFSLILGLWQTPSQ